MKYKTSNSHRQTAFNKISHNNMCSNQIRLNRWERKPGDDSLDGHASIVNNIKYCFARSTPTRLYNDMQHVAYTSSQNEDIKKWCMKNIGGSLCMPRVYINDNMESRVRETKDGLLVRGVVNIFVSVPQDKEYFVVIHDVRPEDVWDQSIEDVLNDETANIQTWSFPTIIDYQRRKKDDVKLYKLKVVESHTLCIHREEKLNPLQLMKTDEIDFTKQNQSWVIVGSSNRLKLISFYEIKKRFIPSLYNENEDSFYMVQTADGFLPRKPYKVFYYPNENFCAHCDISNSKYDE